MSKISQEKAMSQKDVIKEDGYYIQKGIPAELPKTERGTMFGILSIISALVSILFYPIIFGPLGIYFGFLAKERNAKKIGIIGMILSIICMILGFILGFVLYEDINVSGRVYF